MSKTLSSLLLMLMLSFLVTAPLSAQGDNVPQYEFAANIDLSSIKEPILQLNIDDQGYLYLRTYQKLYLLDCNTTPEGAILTTLDLKPPAKTVFLVNNKGNMCFANIREIPVQIYGEKGVLRAALGEMKTPLESYREINQIFYDSRKFFLLAAPRKILYFDPKGNFDLAIEMERPYRIIHLDIKDNIYVLQQSILSPEMKLELERIEDNLNRVKDELKWSTQDIEEIRVQRDELSDEIDELIKGKKDKFENLREMQKNPEINKTWIDNLKEDINDIKEKIEDRQDERKDLYDEYKEKLAEKKKLNQEEKESAKEKVALKKKAKDNARKDEYEVLIYDTSGEMVFSFVLPKPDNILPLFSTYNLQSDDQSNFFGIPFDQGFDLSTILNPANDFKFIKGGAGHEINIYSSDGVFLNRISAEPEPPFNGINHLVVDNQRNLFVMDMSFSRIRKFKLVGASKK